MKRPEVLSRVETLPPLDARLLDVRSSLPTPVTEFGLVDIKQLIANVKATVDPAYQWPLDINSHHLYWPKNDYKKTFRRGKRHIAGEFRALHVNQALLPITFHNWLHRIVEPPPVPDEEVMRYSIDAWEVTTRMFQSIYSSTQWQRVARRQQLIIAGEVEDEGAKIIDEDVLEEIITGNFDKIAKHREQMRRIPPEFQLVDPDKPLPRIAKEVGRLAAPDGLIFTRAATLATAA